VNKFIVIIIAASLLFASTTPNANAQSVASHRVVAAMKKAAVFYSESVAAHGG